jgi:hypothetical protein
MPRQQKPQPGCSANSKSSRRAGWINACTWLRACHPHPAATKPDCIQVSDDLPLLVRRAWTANATRWPRRAFLGVRRSSAVKTVPTRILAAQRLRFAASLIKAAGFAGWVVLIDEAELIGRYSPLQRGRSYSEFARWMGRVPDVAFDGVMAVVAITDDPARVQCVSPSPCRRAGPGSR